MSSRVIEIITSSFTKLLIPGLVYTIPITLISFAIGLLIAIVTALIRIKKIKKVVDKSWQTWYSVKVAGQQQNTKNLDNWTVK